MDACAGGNLTFQRAFDAMRIRNRNQPAGKFALFFAFMEKSGNFLGHRCDVGGARFSYLGATTPATILRIDPAVCNSRSR
jgi:hypothetical protein